MAEKFKNLLSNKRTYVLAGIILLLFAGGILLSKSLRPGGLTPGDATSIPVINDPNVLPSTEQDDKYGIHVKLSDGQSQPDIVEVLPLSTGGPLSPEEIELILSRLPALTPAPDQQTEFNLPQEVLPPPRPGNTIEESFPPIETGPTPGVVDVGVLKVLRFAPEGEIPIAPFVSVTFNQPMVPIGTIGDLAAKDVPVQVEPSLPGTWRWLGTETLTFEYDSELIDRLPKATEYRLTVPAGVKSATGEILAESVTWTFKTPPPKIVTTYPDGSPQPLEPIFFIAFDQRIGPAAVLKYIQVQSGSQSVNIALAAQADIDKDERVSQLVKDTPEGRWLAFRAAMPFPTETNITVTIAAGTPSAEGPLTTTEAQSFTFSTYAPLRIEEHRCSWYDDSCPPLSPFYVRFNNPLDMNVFSEEMLHVEPEIPGVSANVYSNSIEISGETKGQTTYTVTISGKLQDIFGQQLGKDTRLTFKVGKAESVLINSGQNFVTLDPAASQAVYSVYAINYKKLNLKVYAVQPTDWPAYKQYLRERQQTDAVINMPGKLVENTSLNLNLPSDTLTEVAINLSQYMNGDFGHFVVIVEPPAGLFETENDKWRRYSQTMITWVQITQIGLDAYSDHSEIVTWATDLKNGAPLSAVRIQADNGNANVLSGADGVARFDIPAGATYATASKGNDLAILPRTNYFWYDDSWAASLPVDSLRWYIIDDRQMYRPGEEVHIKGWLRRIGGKQDGDVELAGSELRSITYEIYDPQSNTIGNGQAEVNALGGFDFVFTVPENANLGTAELYLTAQGNLSGLDGLQNYHPFQIQEFRRPEFEVNARNETSGPYFAGDQATLAVEAKYYAGGALPNAETTWQVS